MASSIEPIDATGLSSELKQIIGYLQDAGPASTREIAADYCLKRSDVRRRGRELVVCGYVTMNQADVLRLTPAGERLDIHHARDRQLENHAHDAGMTPRQIARDERRMNGHSRPQAIRRKPVRSGLPDQRPGQPDQPSADEGIVTNPELKQLPAEFVDRAMSQIYEQVKIGRFSALRELSTVLAAEWEVFRIESSPLASRPEWMRLGTYLNECRDADGKRIDVRIVNCVEQVCPATLGAIREQWPLGFVGNPNMGIRSMQIVGGVLVAAALITKDSMLAGILEFEKKNKRVAMQKYAVMSQRDEDEL